MTPLWYPLWHHCGTVMTPLLRRTCGMALMLKPKEAWWTEHGCSRAPVPTADGMYTGGCRGGGTPGNGCTGTVRTILGVPCPPSGSKGGTKHWRILSVFSWKIKKIMKNHEIYQFFLISWQTRSWALHGALPETRNKPENTEITRNHGHSGTRSHGPDLTKLMNFMKFHEKHENSLLFVIFRHRTDRNCSPRHLWLRRDPFRKCSVISDPLRPEVQQWSTDGLFLGQ